MTPMLWDVFALISVLFIGFGLGGVCVAVFLYVIERMQNGGRK
jgi:hypothetical protein